MTQAERYIEWLEEQIADAEAVRRKYYYPLNEQTPERLKIYGKATIGKKAYTAALKKFKEIYETGI